MTTSAAAQALKPESGSPVHFFMTFRIVISVSSARLSPHANFVTTLSTMPLAKMISKAAINLAHPKIKAFGMKASTKKKLKRRTILKSSAS